MSANIVKEWKCPYCKETFSTRRQKVAHTKSCSQKPKYNWICNYCGEEFSSRRKLAAHKKENHYNGMSNGGHEKSIEALQKGHIKFLHKCPFCKKEWEVSGCTFSLHVNHCKENPNAIKYKGHPCSKEQRKKISERMKKAHAEGRAGTFPSRKKYEKSYPEKWFESVIKNRFEDQDYEAEYRLGKYFLDFAWPKKKRFIEIDGQQHYRFEDRIQHDKERDAFTLSQGWQILRLSWSDISYNKEEYIKIAKDFIDNGNILPKEEWPKRVVNYNTLPKGQRTEYTKEKYQYLVPGIEAFIKVNTEWGQHAGWAKRLGSQLGISTPIAAYLLKIYFPDFHKTISRAK